MSNFFPGVNRVEYRPDAGPEETLVFRHYNPTENINGRPMEEWLRFSACFFNSFRYLGSDGHYGERAHIRPFDDGTKTVENYKRRLEAAFEFFDKLNLRRYSISDRDMSPDLDNFEDTCRAQDEVCSMALDLQKQYNIRPLYFGCDLFNHPIYANGAATNPDAHVFAFACSQMKRALEMAKRLDAENFLFFHPRDGYQSLIQRQIFRDVQHLGNFYRMALEYRDKIGYRGQFVIQPKPFEPRRFQYESDAMSVVGILRHHGLEQHFKLFVKPGSSRMMRRPYEHDVYMASAFDMLNGVDASDNYPEIHSSTDVVPMNIRDATSIMKCVLEQGGLVNGGGFNLGFRIRREAIDTRDMIHSYILAMDTFARALRNAARMMHDGNFKRSMNQRYMSYKRGIGERLERGMCSFEECEDFVRKCGPPRPTSSRYAHFENMFNFYVYPPIRA